MFRIPRFFFLALLAAIFAFLLVDAQGAIQNSVGGQSVSADEASLRLIVSQYFEAYAKKDLDGLLKLWGTRAVELESRRYELQQTFAANASFEVKNLSIRKLSIDGEKAHMQVAMDVRAVGAKSGDPAAGFRRMVSMQFAKEAGAWKVYHERSAEEELAGALVAAKTEKDRAALLAEDKELLTDQLNRALITLGKRHEVEGNYGEALTIYLLALTIAEQIGDKQGIASSLDGIGDVHRLRGNYPEARVHYQKALALQEALENKNGAAYSLRSIGSIHNLQGDNVQALEYSQKSLSLYEALGDTAGIAYALALIGVVHVSRSDYGGAVDYFQRSLTLQKSLENKDGTAEALAGLGFTSGSQGDYAKSLAYYQESFALYEALGNKAGVAHSLFSIGAVHAAQDDYAQAMEYYQKSLPLYEALGDQNGIAKALQNIGIISRLRGDYARAMEYYQKSLILREAIGDKDGIARTLNSIGNVHRLQGNDAQALEYYQKSLSLYAAVGNGQSAATTMGNIGGVYAFEGDYARGLEYHLKSLKRFEAEGAKNGIASALGEIGWVYQLQGNYAQALAYYQRTLPLSQALGDKEGVGRLLTAIGEIHLLQGQSAQAVESAERASEIARQIGSGEDLWWARTIAGRSYLALNQAIEARQAFEEAIVTIEVLRAQIAGGEQERQQFFESRVSPYQEMIEMLIAQNNLSEALGYAERAKGRVLLDVLRNGRINITKDMTAPEQEKERHLTSRLNSLNTQISHQSLRIQSDPTLLSDLKTQLEKARLEREAFQVNLYAAHPELKSQRGQAEPLTLQQAAGLLPDAKSALLEFVVTEDKVSLFVLTKNEETKAGVDFKCHTVHIKRKDLIARTERLRQRLANHDLEYSESAGELFKLLIKPALAQLQGKTKLVIVPDDVLWELPFQALQPREGHYLIEDYAIAYAPSLTVLREMIKARARQKSVSNATDPSILLAVGNPALGKQTLDRARAVLTDEKLEPLPEAERQATSLARLYGATHSKVYIGEEAREDVVKAEAGKYRMLQLATHGILNDVSPMYSYLMLAPGGSEDGLLEAWEIMNLNLKADLVVLSACDTARGRIGAGEGVIGLTWAFFVAGSSTTVVSQWSVESTSTTELMLQLHRNLKRSVDNPQPTITKAEALRQAQLTLLHSKKYQHPFFWAGFVVVGDGF